MTNRRKYVNVQWPGLQRQITERERGDVNRLEGLIFVDWQMILRFTRTIESEKCNRMNGTWRLSYLNPILEVPILIWKVRSRPTGLWTIWTNPIPTFCPSFFVYDPRSTGRKLRLPSACLSRIPRLTSLHLPLWL